MLKRTFKTAAELQISAETYAAALQVLDQMERGLIEYREIDDTSYRLRNFMNFGPEFLRPFTFNMVEWMTDIPHCGTVCCIGGAIEMVMGYSMSGWDEDQMYPLFFVGSDGGRRAIKHSLTSITVAQAAAALRNFLTDGQPHWREVLK